MTLPVLALPVFLGACGGFKSTLSSWFADDDPRLEVLSDLQPSLKVEKRWSASLGGGSEGGHVRLRLIVQNDIVYACGGDGLIGAFSAQDGRSRWRRNYNSELSFCPGGSGSVLALGTAQGEAIALSAKDGGELWRKKLSRREVTAISSRYQNKILVRTADSKLFALAADNGQLLWSADYPLPVLVLRGMSAPLFHKGYAVLGLDDGRLLLLNLRNGEIEFEARVGIVGMGSDLEKIVDIDGRLQIRDNVVYVAAYQGRTMAYDLEARQILWLSPHGSYAGLTVDDRFAYMADENRELRAFDLYTGAEVWHNSLLGVFDSSAALAYGDFLVLGDSEGYLNWLSVEDGEVLLRKKMRGDAISAAPALWRDTVITLDRKGYLASYKVISRLVRKPSRQVAE